VFCAALSGRAGTSLSAAVFAKITIINNELVYSIPFTVVWAGIFVCGGGGLLGEWS